MPRSRRTREQHEQEASLGQQTYGTGRVRELPSGRFQARFPVDGELIKAPHTFATWKEADDWCTEQRKAVEKGEWRDPRSGAMTLRDFALDEWLPRKTLAPRTAANYQRFMLKKVLTDPALDVALNELREVHRQAVVDHHAGARSLPRRRGRRRSRSRRRHRASPETQIAALGHEIEVLKATVAELEARLSQDSRNSSLPPSSDSPKSRAERRAAAREIAKAQARTEKRARGHQPGASGSNLSMREVPNEVIPLEPGRCSSCGADLSSAVLEGFSARQVFDTSQPVLTCVEHRSMRRRCACGTLSVGAFPADATAPACYGPNIRATALYLLHGQHLSVERTAQALSVRESHQGQGRS